MIFDEYFSQPKLVPQSGSQKSKVKSQKSKVLFSLALRFDKWSVYLRHGVLGHIFCCIPESIEYLNVLDCINNSNYHSFVTFL